MLKQGHLLKETNWAKGWNMFTLRKLTVAVLFTLAGTAGALVVVGPGGALAHDTSVDNEVSVLADSPWGRPQP